MADSTILSERDQSIQKHLTEGKPFQPIDNVPRDHEAERRLILIDKASLLIHSIVCRHSEMALFLECGEAIDGFWVCDLPESKWFSGQERITVDNGSGWWHEQFEACFKLVGFGNSLSRKWYFLDTSAGLKPEHGGEVCAAFTYGKNFGQPYSLLQNWGRKGLDCDPQTPSELAGIASANLKLYSYSLFEVCSWISSWKTPEAVCLYLSEDTEAENPYAQVGGKPKAFFNVAFPVEQDMRTADEGGTNDILHLLSNKARDRQNKLDPSVLEEENMAPETCIAPASYPYETQENNKTRFALLRLFDSESNRKILLPCTSWVFDHETRKGFLPHYYCVPPKAEQPLYNQEWLRQPERNVIVTPSVELAKANQRGTNTNFAWLSWFGGMEAMEYVDWAPLFEHEGPVTFLITNHSGIELTDAMLSAAEMLDRLNELHEKYKPSTGQEKFPLELRVVTLPVNYESLIEGVADTDALQFFSVDEFMEHCDKLRNTLELNNSISAALQRGKIPGDSSSPSGPPPSDDGGGSPSMQQIDWLFRPLIKKDESKGTLTLLHAPPFGAKSSFSLSICAALISKKQRDFDLVRGQWWLAPPNIRGNIRIMYFDVEPQGGNIASKAMTCMNPYLTKEQMVEDVSDRVLSKKPSKEPERKRNESHIVGNASFPLEFLPVTDINKGWDWDDEGGENAREVLKRIDDFMEKGDGHPPLRLVVIDNYFAMVSQPEPQNAWKKFHPFLEKIMSKGISILLIHHSNKKGESAGFQNKEQDCRLIAELIREESGAGEGNLTLRDPVTLTVKSNDELLNQDTAKLLMHIPLAENAAGSDEDLGDPPDEGAEDESAGNKRQRRQKKIPNKERWCVYNLPCRHEESQLKESGEWLSKWKEELEDRALWRFGKIQRELRDSGSYSRDEMAEVLGYKRETYTNYLNEFEKRERELESKFGKA